MSVRGAYFDGDRPVPQPATLTVEGAALVIARDGGEALRWPLAEVRQLPDTPARGDRVLRRIGDPLARLVMADDPLLKALPQRHRRSPPKGRGRLAGWALAAVAAVALQIGVLVPLLADNLAGFIPPEGERALGAATFEQIRRALDETGMAPLRLCEALEGRAVLDRLAARLAPGAQGITVSVLDHEMVNAFALPGGFIVLFRGLLDAAEDPDEVAAVLAHEIGHVVSRDPTRHALRSAGSIGVLGLLFGDFAGGAAVLFLAERLISAQYSQAAEAAADSHAHRVLEAAGITPAALAAMFETMRALSGDAEGVAAHFLGHPTLGARIEAARDAATGKGYAPSMPPSDWAALQGICN
jgi:beta-barrel assembly-enhancing protease